MVADQIFRSAVLVAAASAIASAGASPAEAQHPAVLVDLHPEPPRAGGPLAEALADLPELSLRREPALMAALAGRPGPGTPGAGEAALQEARAAFGELDCERALEAAQRAALHLAAARAADPERADELATSLERAHVYELLCADTTGRPGTAQLAAERLRNLGADEPPEGVSREQWERVPEVDATADVSIVPLSVETEPPGAPVWVDHLPADELAAGAGSHELLVGEGMRLVAAGKGGLAASVMVDVGAPEAAVTLTLIPADRRWEELRRGIAAWRRGRQVNPVELSNLMQRLEARILIVRREGALELWGRAPGARVAQRLGDFGDGEIAEVAEAIGKRVAAWRPRRGAGPQPGVPLLREDPTEREERDDDREPSWWVYASILGAVGLGAAFIIANDLADDRQRIELSWP